VTRRGSPRKRSIGRLQLGGMPRVVLCLTDARGGRVPPRSYPDLVEARIDLFARHTPQHVEAVLRTLRRCGHPTIATIRRAAEGGSWAGTEREREHLFRTALPLVDAVDVELASRALAGRVLDLAHAARRPVIVSAHDMDRTPTPATLARRIEAAVSLGADIVKLAAYAHTMDDVARLLRTLLAHPHVPLVVLAMGPAGLPARVLFAAAGSLLTYAFPEGAAPAAPGQLPLKALQTELARYYPPYAAALRARKRRTKTR
jgi:3-dehydroquinate dehydratase-1